MLSTTTTVASTISWNNILLNLSYVSQIVLAVLGFMIFVQIRIAKKDIQTRSSREARTLAAKQAEMFSEEILPEFEKIRVEFTKDKIFWQPQKFEEFTLEELKKNMKCSKATDKLLEYLGKNDELLLRIQRLINKIDAIAIYFVGEIADEKLVFSSLGEVFCDIVEKFYFMYCINRNKEKTSQGFENTIQLYKIWRNRFKDVELTNILHKVSAMQKVVRSHSFNLTPIGIK